MYEEKKNKNLPFLLENGVSDLVFQYSAILSNNQF